VQSGGYLVSSEDRLELTALIANESESSPYINVADPTILNRERDFFKFAPKAHIGGSYAEVFEVPDYLDGTVTPTDKNGHSFAAPTLAALIAKELVNRSGGDHTNP
jgi:hypothetical protein